jgi:hypothetical protein
LTDAQLATIAATLKPFAGQQYELLTYWQEREPANFRNRINEVLVASGWKPIPPVASGTFKTMLPGFEGIWIFVHPKATSQTTKAASLLAQALNSERIEALTSERLNDSNEGILEIAVGAKPQ